MTTNQNPIQFIPMTCPSCGGEMMVSSKLDQTICNYCGKSFLVVGDVKGGEPAAKNFIELADATLNSMDWGVGHNYVAKEFEWEPMNQKYIEAHNFYTKALEIDPKNYKAWFGKAATTFWNLPFHNDLSQELSCEQSIIIIEAESKKLLGEQLPRIVEAESYYERSISLAPESERSFLQNQFRVEQICMLAEKAEVINQILVVIAGNTAGDEDYAEWTNSMISSIIECVGSAAQTVIACSKLMDDVIGKVSGWDRERLYWSILKITRMCSWGEADWLASSSNNNEYVMKNIAVVKQYYDWYNLLQSKWEHEPDLFYPYSKS